MTWTKTKIEELKNEIINHKGYGESKNFYELREEITEKLGKQEWEKLLRKTKVMAANTTNKRKIK